MLENRTVKGSASPVSTTSSQHTFGGSICKHGYLTENWVSKYRDAELCSHSAVKRGVRCQREEIVF